MESQKLREKFLRFFEKRGHKIITSASLVPENDPTTLFTGSGMQSLIPYLLGQKHPAGARLANSQKCFRAEDIEEVGDNRHTTFFEMLGNWSLGDYFKEKQLSWFFSFLVDEIKLDSNKIYVTCFSGDSKNNMPQDEESFAIWEKLFAERGIDAKEDERIFYYGAEKNWWSRSGAPENMPAGEPGGPNSEIFYDFGIPHDERFGKSCHPNCDCGRFVEIGNSVFMEYKKQEGGSFIKLAQRNVDFGGGLERIAAATNQNSDIFTIDILYNIIRNVEKLSDKKYEGEDRRAFRVIADHIRGVVFMIGDGVFPSNTDRGYFVRRLLRRAVRYADLLGVEKEKLAELIFPVVEAYYSQYPELKRQQELIAKTVRKEESRFRETLANGLKEFEKLSHNNISGKDAFNLYQSYGFPLEVTRDLAEEKGIRVDKEGFKEEFKKHREISRAGAEKKFKGGLADQSEKTTKYHTATHLLLAAMREILGPEIYPKGSNITAERLRFDFNYPQKLSEQQIKKIEDLVNQKIVENIEVEMTEMPKTEALKITRISFNQAKYDDVVKVYKIGDFSVELCGGPHAQRTGELGHFKITKEESSAAGIRRLRAILTSN